MRYCRTVSLEFALPGMPIFMLFSLNLKLTIYRGLYIPNDDRWPVHFRGLNIRIEDSICVQSEHPLVLTTEAVKEVRTFFALHSLRCYICVTFFALHSLRWHVFFFLFNKVETKRKKEWRTGKRRNSISPLPKILPCQYD